MNAQNLYEHLKDAINYFGLDFHDKNKINIEFGENFIIFTCQNKSIAIEDNHAQ